MAIAEALQKAGVNQLLEVLRHARLAEPGDLREFRHAALGRPAQRHEAQAHRVGQGLELPRQRDLRRTHIKI